MFSHIITCLRFMEISIHEDCVYPNQIQLIILNRTRMKINQCKPSFNLTVFAVQVTVDSHTMYF